MGCIACLSNVDKPPNTVGIFDGVGLHVYRSAISRHCIVLLSSSASLWLTAIASSSVATSSNSTSLMKSTANILSQLDCRHSLRNSLMFVHFVVLGLNVPFVIDFRYVVDKHSGACVFLIHICQWPHLCFHCAQSTVSYVRLAIAMFLLFLFLPV